MYQIFHDRNLNRSAGYINLSDMPADLARIPPINGMEPKDKKSLLYLFFWAAYTWEGRQICREYKSGRAGQPRTIPEDKPLDPAKKNLDYYDNAKIRSELGAKYAEFVGEGPLLDALLNAHIAAGEWTMLDQKQGKLVDDYNKLEQSAGQYQNAMSFVTWKLWEDMQGHEFSMLW